MSIVIESIEGNPFIIRFKTVPDNFTLASLYPSIEGNPFIIRFKTQHLSTKSVDCGTKVLKVIHL